MASDLNLDLNYFTHIKTKKLVKSLGKGADILPIRLWCHTGQHYAVDGKLSGLTAEDIEAILEWWGDSGECVKKMVEIGFLDEKKGTYRVHNWEQRSGHLCANSRRASEAAKERWRRVREGKKADAQAMLGHAQASGSNALTNPTHPTNDPTLPTERTLPTHPPDPPAAAGNGAGNFGGNGMGLGRALTRALSNPNEMLEISRILTQANVGDRNKQKLLGRKDVTLERVQREWKEICADPKVDDRGAVLVHRLNQKGTPT